MGKATKALDAFIDAIPVARLTDIPQTAGTLHSDTDFRLDMQGLTTKDKQGKQNYNLQVQINNQTTISTLKKLAPKTVAKALAPTNPVWTADAIKKALKEGKLI